MAARVTRETLAPHARHPPAATPPLIPYAFTSYTGPASLDRPFGAQRVDRCCGRLRLLAAYLRLRRLPDGIGDPRLSSERRGKRRRRVRPPHRAPRDRAARQHRIA